MQTFSELALGLVPAYLSTLSFTVLHCLTAAHAAQLILPYSGKTEAELVQLMWPALAAAYIAAMSVAKPQSAASDLSWPEIIKHVCDSLDDHEIKIIYTARYWYVQTKADIFRALAAKTISHKIKG